MKNVTNIDLSKYNVTRQEKIKKIINILNDSDGYDSEEEWTNVILLAIGESDGIVCSPQNSFNTPPVTKGSTPLLKF